MLRTCLLLTSLTSVTCSAVVPKVKLSDGNEMPAIALGTWLGNSTKGRRLPNSTETERAVVWAIEAGYRHIDTAKAYRVEDQVGRGLHRKINDGSVTRDQVFITTKLWNNAHARKAVVPALQESLAQLNLSYVDLYLIHWPVGQFDNSTYDFTDYLDTWRGMIEAKQLGLTKSIGLSNFNQQMMDRIQENSLETPAALQVEMNLNLQQPALLEYCGARGIVVMGYTPFGSLSYSKAQAGAPPPRIDDPTLLGIATKYNKTVPQIALRYLVELGVVPLPKSLNKARIEENLQVFDFSLTQEEKKLLKGFDRGYRTIPQLKWQDHPYFPFEKNLTLL